MNRAAIVGQGPNRRVWQESLNAAARIVFNPAERAPYAEQCCARLAVTGSVGRRLAELAGHDLSAGHPLRFYATHDRLNLNARWNGKAGSGDLFLRPEGLARAREIDAAGYARVVMLGAEVTACFGWGWEPLRVYQSVKAPTSYLAFPHPSGLNRWWNDPANRAAGAAALREFLNP